MRKEDMKSRNVQFESFDLRIRYCLHASCIWEREVQPQGVTRNAFWHPPGVALVCIPYSGRATQTAIHGASEFALQGLIEQCVQTVTARWQVFWFGTLQLELGAKNRLQQF